MLDTAQITFCLLSIAVCQCQAFGIVHALARLSDTLECSWSNVNIISSTCAFPAVRKDNEAFYHFFPAMIIINNWSNGRINLFQYISIDDLECNYSSIKISKLLPQNIFGGGHFHGLSAPANTEIFVLKDLLHRKLLYPKDFLLREGALERPAH